MIHCFSPLTHLPAPNTWYDFFSIEKCSSLEILLYATRHSFDSSKPLIVSLSCIAASLCLVDFLICHFGKTVPGFESRRDEAEVVERGSVTNVHNPSLTVLLPEKEKANGVGIVIAPGGGLRKLGIRGGGEEPARFLAEHGFTSFVLKYRLSRQPGQPYKFEEHVLADGQRAIRLVRHRAQEFHLDPQKIGMLGFSAEVRWFQSHAISPERAIQMLLTHLTVSLQSPPSTGWWTPGQSAFPQNYRVIHHQLLWSLRQMMHIQVSF